MSAQQLCGNQSGSHQAAAETGGASLAQGMKLLAGDVARGRISMTDEQAF